MRIFEVGMAKQTQETSALAAQLEREILAGDNVKMPSGSVDYILEDLAKGKITREDLRKNAAAIFGAMLRSYDYKLKANENR